jgi:hypothetical protein
MNGKAERSLDKTVMYPERLDLGAGSGGDPDTFDHPHSIDGDLLDLSEPIGVAESPVRSSLFSGSECDHDFGRRYGARPGL